MSSPELEPFEVTDFDLQEVLAPGHGKKKFTKHQAIYGIWADRDSDSDGEKHVGFGGGRRKQLQNDLTTPVPFVSGGFKKETKLPDDKKKKKKGSDGGDDDQDESDQESPDEVYKNSLSQSFIIKKEAETQPKFKKRTDAVFMTKKSDIGHWEKHTKGIGQKLLEKMGYRPGEGLGSHGQGITQPVEAVKRKKDRAALAYYGSEKPNKPAEIKQQQYVDSDEEEKKEFHKKLHQWRKQPVAKKTPFQYVYKTAQDAITTGSSKSQKQGLPSELSKVKVIDMTGREHKVLSGYHAISQRHDRPDEEEEIFEQRPAKKSFDMPELLHNLDLLVDMAEEEIIHNDRKLRHERDLLVNMKYEKERLDEVCDREEKQTYRLKQVLEIIQRCEKRTVVGSEDPLTLTECLDIFKKLQEEFYEEYKMYALSALAVALVFPLVKTHFQQWHPLTSPSYGVMEVREWRQFLEDSTVEVVSDTGEIDMYQRLLWDVWMPCVRAAVMSWNVRDCDPLIELIEIWKTVIPWWFLDNILEQLVMPRLLQDVDLWNPLTDVVPIHAWLHPWLPLMGDKLEPLYAPIRQKLAQALTNWHPSDSSAKLILQPWINVFRAGQMEAFLIRNILPKLSLCMQEFVINPHQQILEPWQWIMSWKDMIPPPSMASMLEKSFFPKWIQVLSSWLTNSPNYEEVTNWYLGWKSQFPDQLLSQPPVKENFSRALDYMNQAVSGTFTGTPRENMASFSSADRQNVRPQQQSFTSDRGRDSPKDRLPVKSTATSKPYSFKDLVEKKAQDNDLLFMPLVGKMHEAKQVYCFGQCQVYIDRSVIFILDNNQWVPVSLQSLIDRAR